MNYRNKSIFDWYDYKPNDISSTTSLEIMNYLKNNTNEDIKNVIIRDIDSQIGIIVQINNNIHVNNIFNLVNRLNYDLKFFAIQTKFNNTFVKNKNMFILKNDFISFEVNYLDRKIIKLLPDSFYQVNIGVLDQYYDNFIRWIEDSKCRNMINLGDDGGNICNILSSLFDSMASYFHCTSSYRCAEEMIKVNGITNLQLTFNLDDIKLEDAILFINPGRKGLKQNEINFILKSNIKYVIYMACNDDAFQKNIKQINYKILECVKILSMPVINKFQFLYFCVNK